jgi:23S rRNA (cytidine1920-2'-O)/16S rRNA (cytidine1409-2'-O)-methyltransferase
VGAADPIEVELPERQWASRGAYKLLAALDTFGVDPRGRVAFDIGASTGGFTEVLLSKGAEKVYALDVGHGQLDARLKQDPRVINVEKYHARNFDPADFETAASLLVMDVSFISVRLVIPAVVKGLTRGADLLVLFKPQFEVGREHLGSGGIVRDGAAREAALSQVVEWSRDVPLVHIGSIESPIIGGDGNHEYLIHWKTL